MNRSHFGQHGEDCFACKLSSIQFGNVMAPGERIIEKRQERDLPAYRRLRQQGYVPKATKGCAELEARAHSEFEIGMHKLVDPQLWGKAKNQVEDTMQSVKEGMFRAKQENITPAQIREWKDKARGA